VMGAKQSTRASHAVTGEMPEFTAGTQRLGPTAEASCANEVQRHVHFVKCNTDNKHEQ
jgi:hypothetical protein